MISEFIETGKRCHQIVVANVYSVALAYRDKEFSDICDNSDIVFPDGLPIVLGSILLRTPLPARIAGPDFMWKMCEVCAQKGYNIFLLGGRSDFLGRLNDNLCAAFPKIKIVGAYSPPFGNWDEKENVKIIKMINTAKTDLLWVGVSTPKQDVWIHNHKKQLTAKVAIAVGAAFDFHSGRVKRAPVWMQRICLEWVFRLIQEPRRQWKKYLVSNSIFIFILVKEFVSIGFKKKFKKL
jgi:N-acetylglucosaminyldiphosphoundecaprenol N-acetyl-beta-D-mannosaminyltransferase